ncbi:MAG TPA: peptidoglycan bridge formation glycyltransferase FemA/FemB family protein [Candidatus Doudnabacteria bacterium]|nr:peptidoglycan bridge formation glycyltransferase FemA/FemB family protein [Candidatus Doudnabacteria bacterium]
MFTEVTSKEIYNKSIAQQSNASFLQSWEWGEFQKSLGHKVFRFALEENNNDSIHAQFIEQTIPHLSGKYIYCPYGPVGNFKLLAKLIQEVQKRFPNYWFIRIEPKDSYQKIGQKTIRIQPAKTLITDLTSPAEELLKQMHTKTRYNIKVAQKHNVEVSIASTQGQINEALNLITNTGLRQEFSDHPRSYYDKLISNQNLNLKFYTASWQGKLLSSAIMVDYNNTRTYLFGGSAAENKNLMTPYALHWQAMQDAKSEGFTSYDWWGIETSTGKQPGFVRFKLGWGGTEVEYPPAQDVPNKPVHYFAYKILRKLNRLF